MARARYKYKVTLTEGERQELECITKRGKGAAYRIRHAQILLNADSNGPDRPDKEIAEFIGCHSNTVYAVRQRFVEQGWEAGLERKKREIAPRKRKLDGSGEAQLLAIACQEPPEGRSGWTLQLLCDKLVELQVVDSICPATVHKTLKKTKSSRIYANVG